MVLRMPAGALLVVALMVGGCGGSDDPDDPAVDAGDSSSAEDPAVVPDDSDGDDPAEPETGGDASAVLTMADDTVYEFVLTSCDTQDTDPTGFPLSNGYDVSGKTADGEFGLYVGRAGFTDDEVFSSGTLEGDFDENGQNSTMLYMVDTETTDLTASGTQVSGSVDFRAIGPTRPHGDETSGTLEASC